MGQEAAVASKPRESALDNPAPPHHFETAFFVRALDDFKPTPLRGQVCGEFISKVAAIGKDMFDEGEQAARLFD